MYPSWQFDQGIEIAKLLTNLAQEKAEFTAKTDICDLFIECEFKGTEVDGIAWGWNWQLHEEKKPFQENETEASLAPEEQQKVLEFYQAFSDAFKEDKDDLFEMSGIDLDALINFVETKIKLPQKMVSLSSQITFFHKRLIPFNKPGGIAMADNDEVATKKAQRIVNYFLLEKN